MRLNDAGVVDDAAGQTARSFGREVDQTGIGANNAAVVDQGVQRALGNLQLDRATQVQRDLAARAQHYIAAIGCQHTGAGVGDCGGDQRNRATFAVITGSRYISFVNDGGASYCIASRAVKLVVSRHEVSGGDAQGGGHQAADTDLRRRGKEHAVGVDQKHLAVGVQSALDHGHIGA